MKHTEWFAETTKNDAVNAVANRAGIVQRTLARQLDRGHIDAEYVIKIAIAYKKHPVRALVETQFLDEKYAKEVDITTAIKEVDEMVIIDEVLRRMHSGQASENLTKPADEVKKERGLHAVSDARGSMPSTAVADDSPDEDALREDGDWTDPDNIP